MVSAENRINFEEVHRAAVRLRPFPFPYRAGLAICSDIDGCDRKVFISVHRFLNESRGGLGLPVSDSFFAVGREKVQMAYFLPDGSTHSPDADFIRRAIRSGLIDSIHSWGDFNANPPHPNFLRDIANRLTAEFLDIGLQLKVWINHGSPHNRQNLKSRLQSAYKGDDPQSSYYTSDLLQHLGIQFYWWSEVVSWPLSGNNNKMSSQKWIRLRVNMLKNMVKSVTGHRKLIRKTSQLVNLGQPVILRDGSSLIGFTRFNYSRRGPWSQPTRHTLRQNLCLQVLNDLIEQEGYMVLYTHFGLPPWGNEPLFPDPDKRALIRLSEFFHDGKIWIAPTSRLLTYWFVSKYLDWQVSQEGNNIIIDLCSLKDPSLGPRHPHKYELAGLCFYTPRPIETVIRVDKQDLPVHIYPPDHTGQASVGIAPAPSPDTDLLEE
jgi:hypothetical protein